MNRKDLQSLAQVRLKEARVLLDAGLADGAYYLAGYALECALKACIAKSTQRHDFPDKKSADASHTHDLKRLVEIAKLGLQLSEQANKDSSFRDNWDLAQRWSELSRYRRHDHEEAQALVEAIAERKHGVIKWIKQHW